jgi:uncharacterized protein involved in exopolysaccharide biosynthesis
MTSEYFRNLFARQWWIVAICVLAVGAGAFLGSYFLAPSTPQYTASSLVEADVAGSYSDLTGYLATEGKLAVSARIVSTIVSNYPGLTVADIQREASASSIAGTHLIQITVSDTSATRAAKIANDLANALVGDQQQASQARISQAQQQIQNQLGQLQNQINQTQDDLNRAIQSNNQSDIATQEAQLSSLREEQALLQYTLAQTQLSITQGSPALSVAQEAVTGTRPAHSQLTSAVKYAAGGILLGLVMGIALVLARDLLTRRQNASLAVKSATVANAK